MTTQVKTGEIQRVRECFDGGYIIRIARHKMKISKEGEVVRSSDWDKVKQLADHHPLFTWDIVGNETVVLYLGWTS